MPGPLHLLVAITAHGYGHGAQTIPVVNALRALVPVLRVTFLTALPERFLAARLDGDYRLVAEDVDIGMRMASAVDVLRAESAAAYQHLHRDWDRRVREQAKRLQRLAPDLVLANVPYLTLAAAGQAGIAAVAMSSLNWADMYRHYLGERPEADEIHAQILDAYRSAACFLQLEPSMPMPDLRVTHAVGPVAVLGRNRRAALARMLGLRPGQKLVWIAPGGLPMRLPIERWPRSPGVRWVVQEDWQVRHPDTVALERLGLPIADLVQSCDAIVGKPGYGTFVEAGCNGTPMLYLPRRDWPEEPYLIEWLRRHGRSAEIAREQLEHGDLLPALEALAQRPAPRPAQPTGAAQAAAFLARNWFGVERELPGPEP